MCDLIKIYIKKRILIDKRHRQDLQLGHHEQDEKSMPKMSHMAVCKEPARVSILVVVVQRRNRRRNQRAHHGLVPNERPIR